MSKGFCSKCTIKLTKAVCSPTVYKRQKGYCRSCNAQWSLEKYHKDDNYRKRSNALHRLWCKDQYLNNSEYKEQLKLQNWINRLKRVYNLNPEQYKQLYINQQGLCKICKQPETKYHHSSSIILQLSIDHCHKTGKVRGLLCFKCNNALGKYEKYKDVFEEYLCATS